MYLFVYFKLIINELISTFEWLPETATPIWVFAHLKRLKFNYLSAKQLEDAICVHGNSFV